MSGVITSKLVLVSPSKNSVNYQEFDKIPEIVRFIACLNLHKSKLAHIKQLNEAIEDLQTVLDYLNSSTSSRITTAEMQQLFK